MILWLDDKSLAFLHNDPSSLQKEEFHVECSSEEVSQKKRKELVQKVVGFLFGSTTCQT